MATVMRGHAADHAAGVAFAGRGRRQVDVARPNVKRAAILEAELALTSASTLPMVKARNASRMVTSA